MRHGYEKRAALWNELNGATLALRHAQDRHERALRAIEAALIATEMEPQGTTRTRAVAESKERGAA